MAHHSPEVASNAIMSSGQGNCEDSTAMSSEDEDWETMLDSLIISADEDTGDE
ncbi:hypothetical protein KIN20_020981 [Parelaphostrongylus tenuis]|uniref:Uncharacterized protein n=1 Tax=Parelaphostrongylus tenuis TaxID=148309 RepID=A0AAD5QTW1_PARTN|nr:hypothetical protein KIN20_020974 [Parelaphostrongylus tenuis]KAJ1361675.1 hypothetical protein KIN20_020981 [Parelaphostrongylus tenuis]